MIQVNAGDPDILQVHLFSKQQRGLDLGRFYRTGKLISVEPHLTTQQKVVLRVYVTSSICGEFGDEQHQILGTEELFRIAGALHERVKDQEFDP